MQRSNFIKMFTAAGTFLAMPFTLLAREKDAERVTDGFTVGAGKARFDKPITLFEGDKFFTKVSAKDTDGDLYVYESIRVKKGGPPLHRHYSQDEIWYVLEGEFLIKVGEQLYTARAGDTVFGPRGVPHAFSKTSEGNGRLLMTFQPAGKMEEFFIASSEGKLAKMTAAEQEEFKKQHGFEKVGPALEHEKTP